MFNFIKQALIALLSFSRSLATKYMSLDNKICLGISLTLNFVIINLWLIWIHGSWNSLGDPSVRICVPNKSEDIHLNKLNKSKNKLLKTIAKHIFLNVNFDDKKFDSNQKWNED